MNRKPDFTSTSGTIALTNGIMISRPSGALTTRTSWPECSTSSTVPTCVPSTVRTARPTKSTSWNSSGSSDGAIMPASALSQVPRSSAAASLSLMPSNRTRSSPECHFVAATVSGPSAPGSVSSREPFANRSSGSSVRTPTTTSPRIPCGRPIRPTVTCTELPDLAGLQQVDADVPVPSQGTDHGPQRPGGPAAPAYDLAQVIGVDADFEYVAPAEHPAHHADVVRVADDAPDQVIEGLLKHLRPRRTRPERPRRARLPQPQRAQP